MHFSVQEVQEVTMFEPVLYCRAFADHISKKTLVSCAVGIGWHSWIQCFT